MTHLEYNFTQLDLVIQTTRIWQVKTDEEVEAEQTKFQVEKV
jgi:hypothetical protein